MDTLFIKLLNMSIAASWLILAVIILRVLLKKAPKWINCILWGLVAVRLVCPFSFESAISLIPSEQTIPNRVLTGSSFEVKTGITRIDAAVNEHLGDTYFEGVSVPVNNGYNIISAFSILWIAGIGCLLLYALVSFFRLHRKVSEAVPLRDNVWEADNVKSPFILGIVSPKIYVSSGVSESQIDYILAHEQAHIKRKDHIWKFLGYLLLAIYWFNPLSWVAYILFCRDIELACDEKVICGYDEEEKVKYSNTLLCCSMQRKLVIVCPLAFGEVAVKERVKSVMKYKKPAFWLLCVSVMVCIIVAVCFLTNPVTSNAESGEITYANENRADTLIADVLYLQNGKTGEMYYSVDGGTAYIPMSEEEFRAQSTQVEWWTYDEYADWLENEKKGLQSIIGSRSWSPSRGWYTWTQEMVDETVAMYEKILQQIKDGYKVSKSVDGSNDVMLMQGTADYDADVNNADDTAIYDYHTELLAAYRSFGLTYNETEKEMYFNGKLVRYFVDGVDIGDGKAVVYDFLNEKGVVDVHTIREATQNEDGSINPIGRLVGIEEDSKAEFDNRDITAQTGVEQTTAYGDTDGAGGSTFEEVFSKYMDYGITYVEAANASGAGNVYYNGQLVNRFSDVTPDGSAFSFQSGEKSGINVRTVYGSNGKITGIEIVQ